jgi:hypothetical protein
MSILFSLGWLPEWITTDFRNMPATANREDEEIVDAAGKDDVSRPEQVKRPSPWSNMMMMMIIIRIVF